MTARQERLLREELERWTYKPGYQLYLPAGGPDVWSGHQFELRTTQPDSRNPDDTKPLVFRAYLHPAVAAGPETFLADWLQTTIGVFELHERDEWLRRDGQLLNDPHAAR